MGDFKFASRNADPIVNRRTNLFEPWRGRWRLELGGLLGLVLISGGRFPGGGAGRWGVGA
eukprot:1191224-Prorocentrum_minimum.AAC.1